MFDKYGDKLGMFAMKISNNRYITTIKNTFISIIPFTIVGAIAILLGSVLFAENLLGGINGLEFLMDLKPLFDKINFASMNIMSIMVAYLMGYNLANEFQVRDSVFAGLVSLASYIILAPNYILTEAGNPESLINNLLHVDVTGSKGLFLAIITGIIAARFYITLVNIDKLEIKLHESVPENVSRSFSSLIPTAIVMFAVGIFGFVFQAMTNMEFSDLIYQTVQIPLEAAMQTPFGIIAMAFISQVLWLFGIHGSSIVNGITDPILLSALATNGDLVAQGLEPTQLITRPSWNIYATMGGGGSTLALLLAIFLFSKREDERAIAKISVGPGLFGINEPVIFGMPMVFNPTYAIPFVFAPVVSVIIGYFATYVGIAAPPIVNVPWSSPPFVNAFIATGGHIPTVLVQMFCFVVVFLIYLPFVRLSSKQFAKEQEMKEQELKE